jgi:hypothetical protein
MFNAKQHNYQTLASKIILQAVEDYYQGNKDDVIEFFETAWFETIAEISGIDPQNAKATIRSGQLQHACLKRGEVCQL